MTDTQPDVMQEDITCDVCGRTFKSKLGLGIHKGRTHAHVEEPTADGDLDRESLLGFVFEDGYVPVAMLDRVQAWLDEAESLRAE